ncbi:MAG: NAD(P)-dependent oxidoreductase [Alphaproteobacteria bacterium]
MKLGFVGLGAMGGALARRLMLSHRLRVYDLDAARVAEFAAEGAEPAASPAGLASECDLVMTCLPTSDHVRAALFGPDGIAAALPGGGIVADMTSGDPNATRAMAAEMTERGLTLLDAPVSGGPAGAAAGTIAIMVGADTDSYARIEPVFRAISPNLLHCGPVGTGHTMKLVNNMTAAGALAITFETLAMGVKNGLDLDTMMRGLNMGSGRSFISEALLPRLLDGHFAANFQIGLLLKDVSLAARCGAASGAPMPLGGLVAEIIRAAVQEHGYGADMNILVRSMERAAQAHIVPQNGPDQGDRR